ncbi:putative transcription factor interactor and regulator CCHC(Zn) family protein [Tanacetum coccineum]
MTMAANAYKVHKNSELKIVQHLVAGFTGTLKGWWDSYLTEAEKWIILNAKKTIVKTENNIQTETQIEDMINTLIFAILKNFVGDPTAFQERNSVILLNLTCRKLSDFRWYTDVFLAKVMTRPDCREAYWKERFIAGLPRLFAEKISDELKNQIMKIMINEESSDSSISDFEENDLNIVENESTSSNESEECAYLGSICKPLYDRLKKNPKPWTEEHTKIVKNIKDRIKELPCLNIPHPEANLIVETDASDIGYGAECYPASPVHPIVQSKIIKDDGDDMLREIRDGDYGGIRRRTPRGIADFPADGIQKQFEMRVGTLHLDQPVRFRILLCLRSVYIGHGDVRPEKPMSAAWRHAFDCADVPDGWRMRCRYGRELSLLVLTTPAPGCWGSGRVKTVEWGAARQARPTLEIDTWDEELLRHDGRTGEFSGYDLMGAYDERALLRARLVNPLSEYRTILPPHGFCHRAHVRTLMAQEARGPRAPGWASWAGQQLCVAAALVEPRCTQGTRTGDEDSHGVEKPARRRQGEIKKLESEYWNLKVRGGRVMSVVFPTRIQGSVKASKPHQSMQKAIEFATEMMDKKLLTAA